MHVLIVDDHPILHQTLGAVVRAAMPDAEVSMETNLGDALASAGRLQDALKLVLLDLGLPGCSGMEALTRFRRDFPKPRLVVVSATDDAASVEAAFDVGAVGYIPKTTAPGLMVAALRLVVSGGTYLPPQLMETLRRGCRGGGASRLAASGLPIGSTRFCASFRRGTRTRVLRASSESPRTLSGSTRIQRTGRSAWLRVPRR